MPVIYILLVAAAWLLDRSAKAKRKSHKPSLKNSSVLLTFYTDGRTLLPGAKNMLESGAGHINFISGLSAGMVVDIAYLPFTTDMRLLGIPTKGARQINPSGRRSLMKPVVLEGDFPNYFSLYSNHGEEIKARYVLDPKAMAFVVDICKTVSWELINDELIFVTPHGMDKKDIDRFIKEIRPAVEISAETVNPNTRPEYKHSFFKILKCPICDAVTYKNSCPNGHGRILTGKELSELPRDKLNLVTNVQSTEDREINCPNCGQLMVQVYYAANTTIDSCTNCPYRWLDAGELE